jgi:hypothetical protein
MKESQRRTTLSISEYINTEYLDKLEDASDVVQYRIHPAFDAVPFVGSIKKHPYDQEKCLVLLLHKQERMPWFKEGELIELKTRDVQALDELPSSIDFAGTAINIFRIWVRRRAIAVRFEPFEVTDEEFRPFDANSISRVLSNKGN